MPNVYILIAQYEAPDDYYPPYENLVGVFATKDEAEKACEEFDKSQREHDDWHNYLGCDVEEMIFGKILDGMIG